MARQRTASTGTPATSLLTRSGVAFDVHTYHHDPAASSYGLEAASALGVAAERVFKTLVAEVDGSLCVAVVPVERSLD
ncbi:MAG: Cys-tRNA(Pro) deacylase, partial [Nocardioidaceae bacterium]